MMSFINNIIRCYQKYKIDSKNNLIIDKNNNFLVLSQDDWIISKDLTTKKYGNLILII